MTACAHHFRQLELARQAFELGARRTVVQAFTGLSEVDLRRVFEGSPLLHQNHGGKPSSPEKLFVNAVTALQASHFHAYFHHLYRRGIAPDEALVVAYRRYLTRYLHDTRLEFDRAFRVVTWTYRLWSVDAPVLEGVRCRHCAALFLGVVGTSRMLHPDCPFCKASQLFGRRQRLSSPLTPPALSRLVAGAPRPAHA